MPNGMIQWFKKMIAACVGLVLTIGTARVNLDYQLVSTIMNWFPCVFLGRDPTISTAINSSVPLDV